MVYGGNIANGEKLLYGTIQGEGNKLATTFLLLFFYGLLHAPSACINLIFKTKYISKYFTRV